MNNTRFRLSVCIATLCLLAGTALAQSNASVEDMAYKGLSELNIFGGISKIKGTSQGLGNSFDTGPLFGARYTGNYWKYIGLELGYGYAHNNLNFKRPLTSAPGNTAFPGKLHQFNVNPVFHFTPRGAKMRPFLTAGLSAVEFRPGSALPGGKDNLFAALNYGGGLKYHLSDRIGMRFDMRGLWTKHPNFELPAASTTGYYMPGGLKTGGVQATAGLDIYFGKKSAPPPPPPPPPPAKPDPLPNLIPGVIRGYEGDHYAGQPLTLRLEGASDPAGKTVTYRWKVNGADAGTGLTYAFSPNAGNITVEVEQEAPNNEGYPARRAKAGPVTFPVRDYGLPTVSVSPNPDTVNVGDPVRITLTTTPGAGATSVTTRVTASEGGVTGSGNNWTLDTTGVRFDQNGKPQSKNVTLTATATNNSGKSATATATVKVNYTPKAIRFSDVIFSKGAARVNNCGKRILIDELAAKAADPDYDVVLVGHIDADEAPKVKLPASVKPLSYRRALQAAAVLTAGKGTCAKLDPSRVKIVDAGTQQLSDMQPGLCGTSARPAAKERSLRQPTEKDQNRRVEVWLVPRAGQAPAAANGASPAPERELKRLACPN